MTTSTPEKAAAISRLGASTQSRFFQLEEAAKKLFQSTINPKKRTVPNALAMIQFGTIDMLVPRDYAGDDTSTNPVTFTGASSTVSNTILLNPPSTGSRPRMRTFSQNIDPPSLSIALPPPGARLETIAQLAYCNNLLRTQLSPYLDTASILVAQDTSQKASVDAILQDKDEQDRVRELTIRVIEEFIADSLKTSDKISEVIFLGPFLVQEHFRKLLNCFIAEFETARLLEVDLLQGLVQLIESAAPYYLQPDDLIRIFVVLRTRLQDSHQQTTKHPYHLTRALSRLLDVMVEGKVQDLRRIVDQEPMSALLGQLIESTDPCLKHQAAYALQGLLHIPNDETRRQLVLRHAGNIAMGLLGVASVCKLDFSEATEGAIKLYKTTVDTLEVGSKVVSGINSIRESGQDILSGRRVWYTALREAQEHIRNGRLSDFNQLIFEVPCRQDIEFQWGVCQLLKDIAIDLQWDIVTRQHAIELLASLYRDDANWTSDEEILVWILNIIRQVASLPDVSISGHARSLLQDLEKKGNTSKQALHHECHAAPVENFPINVRLSNPQSSLLLRQVLAIPDVEYVLHRLRTQRLKERENVLYIPPQAKHTFTSNDSTLFSLMEKTLEFLTSPAQVLLLLGDSGGGKSTFNLQLEYTLWKEYQRGDPIPLYINLPAIDNPQDDMIEKQLRRLRLFSDAQIQELRQSRQIIVICDGYDESQLRINLHSTNQFNQIGQWKTKMIISCRSQYLGQDYRARFQPTIERYKQATIDHMLEVVIAPFSRVQIEQYVEQYVRNLPAHDGVQDRPAWTADEFMERLTEIPKLLELVSNPFLLTLALKALPEVVGSRKDLSVIRVSRVQLYDVFVKQWLEVNKHRLESSSMSDDERSAFDMILDDGFLYHGIQFQKDLAAAIYKEQAGQPVVKYTHLRDKRTWKSMYFSTDDTHTKLLRESSTVTRFGTFFRFIHRSLLEYFYSRTVYDPVDYEPDASSENYPQAPDPKIILSERNFIKEASVLQFLAERVESDAIFKAQLLDYIEDSKADAGSSQAAANAISILVRAGVRFHGADLRGIRISGADLYGGQFNSANLESADLRNVNFSRAWLREAKLGGAQMSGVQFGELPYLDADQVISNCVFSSDGGFLALSTDCLTIAIYETATWNEIAIYLGGEAIAISPTTRELAKGGKENTVELGDIQTGKPRLICAGHNDEVACISFAPDGTQIATASKDTTVRIWSTFSGETLHILCGHSESTTGVVFSPAGLQVASCSEDKTVRIWNAQTGDPLFVLEGHTYGVLCVTYSPDGSRLASGDDKGAVVLWNAYAGERLSGLSSSSGKVFGISYSPDAQQIASCGEDGNIRLWDVSTCQSINILSGHTGSVSCVAYSPTGEYIASGSVDETVRLWKVERALSNAELGVDSIAWKHVDMSPDGAWVVTSDAQNTVQLWETGTGKLGPVMTGHIDEVNGVTFSPCGQLVASFSNDGAVRLWNARTGIAVHVLVSHIESVSSVAFSPNGRQIISAGKDKSIRLWDTDTGALSRILEGHTSVVNNVVYSPMGQQIASCSNDHTVRLWCAETGEQFLVLEHSEVDKVMFSPDGEELISSSRRDGNLYCWDLQSGERLEGLESLPSNIVGCCYSSDGQRLATVDGGGSMQIWSRSSGHCLEIFETVIGITKEIVWRQSSEEQFLIALGVGTMRLWRLIEKQDEWSLQLVWAQGKKGLALLDANFSGVEGLSPVDLKLITQRGAISGFESDSSGESTGDDGDQEKKEAAPKSRGLDDMIEQLRSLNDMLESVMEGMPVKELNELDRLRELEKEELEGEEKEELMGMKAKAWEDLLGRFSKVE